MSESIEVARKRLDRVERLLKASKYAFGAYLVLVTGFIVVQQFQIQQGQAAQYRQAQASLDKSLSDSRAQQRKTQDYVKCVANALLVPLAQRSSAVFDKCGIDTTTDGSVQASPASTSQPVTPTRPASSEQAPTVQQPTTSAPPDPQQGQPAKGGESAPGNGLIRTITSLPTVGPILLSI